MKNTNVGMDYIYRVSSCTLYMHVQDKQKILILAFTGEVWEVVGKCMHRALKAIIKNKIFVVLG